MVTESVTIAREDRTEPSSGATLPRGPSRDGLAYATVLLAGGDAGAATSVLRNAAATASSRAEAVAATLVAASLDPDFLVLVGNADAERDARNFAQGEFLYWSALNLYGLHYGYITQYAHCLKEQGKLVDAEANYRSALALGGPALDLHRHIAACAEARGAPACLPAALPPAPDPADLPPTLNDVTDLLALILHRGPGGPEESLALLRDCPRRRDVALALIARDEFTRANPDLMTLLAGER